MISKAYKYYEKGPTITIYIGKELDGGMVASIQYHEPSGEGDAHYIDVLISNGKRIRIFQPDEIEFEEV